MHETMDTRTRLLTDRPLRVMISLSLPAIIGMVVIGLYNFMDAVFVGQMIGPSAMGAVTVAYPFTLINSGISTLIGVGSASVLSRAVGRKDQDTIDRIMGNLIALVAVLSAVITIAGMVFTRQILTLSGAEGEIMDQAERYLRIIFAGSLFVNFAQAANMVMRGEGLLKRAMIIMGIGALLNIALDPLLIKLLNPLGKGVEGAAYATVISQVVQAVITVWYFLKKSKTVRIRRIHIDGKILPEVLSVGVSAMLMQVMQLVQQTLMYNTAARYGGDAWQIILGASLRLQAFAFIPLWGISQGFQPAAGTNYGAGEYDRVKRFMRIFVLGATALAAVFYIPVMLAPKAMLSLFITDASIVEQGTQSLRILFSTYITLGFLVMCITLFQALGKGGKAALLTVLRQVLLFIPLVLVLPHIGKIGVQGVFLAPAMTDIGVLILCIVMVASLFRSMTAQKKTI